MTHHPLNTLANLDKILTQPLVGKCFYLIGLFDSFAPKLTLTYFQGTTLTQQLLGTPANFNKIQTHPIKVDRYCTISIQILHDA